MTPSEIKKARENSARLAALSPSKKKVLSPFSPKRPATLSQRIHAMGIPKEPKIVEVPVYYGKPGEKGPKGDQGTPGRNGKDGRHGKDGITPVKGTHYFTEAEVEKIKQEVRDSIIIPEPQQLPEMPAMAVDTDFVKKIIQIMHSLPENDKLEVSKGIRNAQSFIYGGTKYQTSELMHGGGSSGSSGTTYYTPTGTINATNTVFGVTGEPSSVISDGITYFEGFGYSFNGGLNQITMDIPPSQFIKYSL